MFLTGLGIFSVVFGFQSFSTHFENLLKANGIHDQGSSLEFISILAVFEDIFVREF